MPEEPTLDEQLQAIYDDMATQKDAATTELETLTENKAVIDENLISTQESYDQYEALVQNLTVAVENHSEDVDPTTLETLQASLTEATANRDSLLSDLTTLQTQQETAQAAVDEKQSQIENYSASMDDISGSIESMFPDTSSDDMVEDDDDEDDVEEQQDEDPDPEPDIDPDEEYVDPDDEDLEPDDMNLDADEPLDYLDDEDL